MLRPSLLLLLLLCATLGHSTPVTPAQQQTTLNQATPDDDDSFRHVETTTYTIPIEDEAEKEMLMDHPAFVEMGATAASTEAQKDTLDCKCEAFECSCKKECICRITENPFGGKKVEGGDNKSSKKRPDGKKPIVFKCGCDFGATDFQLSKDEGLDCDCAAAKCNCEKKCSCRLRSGGEQVINTRSDGGGESSESGGEQRTQVVEEPDRVLERRVAHDLVMEGEANEEPTIDLHQV